jgi:MFS transporter, ACS family, allantoate permease
VILAIFAVVQNWSGAMAIRFLMGVFEAASMPGFALLASQWYTVQEHNSRSGGYIASNGGGQIVGGLVAWGIARGTSDGSALAPWKIIFIATGVFTSAVGVVFFFVVPDSQLNCRWLNKRDRLLAIERVRENGQGIGNRHFKWHQFREALLDPFTWALCAYGLLSDIPNGGITNFFSQLIVNFGYTPLQSLLYGIPGGGVVIFFCIFNGFFGDYFKQRTLIACIPMLCATLGMLLIIILPLANNTGRLIGYYMTQALPAPGATVLSLIASNVAGYTKKTTVAALYMSSYCIGNVVGPQTFRPTDAPRYVSAEVTILVCFALCILDLLFINWWCRRENRRKAAIRASPDYVPQQNQG